jgi:hypothetical protein
MGWAITPLSVLPDRNRATPEGPALGVAWVEFCFLAAVEGKRNPKVYPVTSEMIYNAPLSSFRNLAKN